MFKPNTLELTHYAFTTIKGTFTLSATHSNGTDEWKHTKDKTFHTWSRKEVYSWWESGKIEVAEEATSLTWQNQQNIPIKKKRK